MKVLLVYPVHPVSFWNFKFALKFVLKKYPNPPLGLMTVAAMLPSDWKKRLVDMNVEPLSDHHLKWADLVFLSAISIQQASAREVIQRCRKAGVRVVAGGPLFTNRYASFEGVDHFVLNEAEVTLPRFLEDFQKGSPKPLYQAAEGEWADLTHSPLPLRSLARLSQYGAMNIQYSRGCPFHCNFCDITTLFGRQHRNKTTAQILDELDDLYLRGWRGSVFFVDDNFIGNKRHLKESVLPALADWMNRHRWPFAFYTQASINLVDDSELIRLMTQAGFDRVFIGIETPESKSLEESNKSQNRNRDLIHSVQRLHQAGLEVMAGFIVGFDHDPPDIFDRQIRFIQSSGVVSAMVSMLRAMDGTILYQQLKDQNRLLHEDSGNNTEFSVNFIPEMGAERLIEGFRGLISKIYSPEYYYKRIVNFINHFKPTYRRMPATFTPQMIWAFLNAVVRLGILGEERRHFWRLLSWTFIHHRNLFPRAVTLAIYGWDYRKTVRELERIAADREVSNPEPYLPGQRS